MSNENLKRKCNQMVEIMESCFDENNENDGLSFDERLQKKLKENREMKEFYEENNGFE